MQTCKQNWHYLKKTLTQIAQRMCGLLGAHFRKRYQR